MEPWLPPPSAQFFPVSGGSRCTPSFLHLDDQGQRSRRPRGGGGRCLLPLPYRPRALFPRAAHTLDLGIILRGSPPGAPARDSSRGSPPSPLPPAGPAHLSGLSGLPPLWGTPSCQVLKSNYTGLLGVPRRCRTRTAAPTGFLGGPPHRVSLLSSPQLRWLGLGLSPSGLFFLSPLRLFRGSGAARPPPPLGLWPSGLMPRSLYRCAGPSPSPSGIGCLGLSLPRTLLGLMAQPRWSAGPSSQGLAPRLSLPAPLGALGVPPLPLCPLHLPALLGGSPCQFLSLCSLVVLFGPFAVPSPLGGVLGVPLRTPNPHVGAG